MCSVLLRRSVSVSANSSILCPLFSYPPLQYTTLTHYTRIPCLSTHFPDTMYVKPNTYEQQREQPTAVRHFNDGNSKQEEITNGNRAGVAPLPEENLEISKDPGSPGKLRNWSGTHSSPANTISMNRDKWGRIHKQQREQKCFCTSVRTLQRERGVQTSSALHSFSSHKVLRSCKSTSGSGGRDLVLLWLRRDVRVGGLWTLLIADSEKKKKTFKGLENLWEPETINPFVTQNIQSWDFPFSMAGKHDWQMHYYTIVCKCFYANNNNLKSR